MEQVDYVFVTFKHVDTIELAVDQFQKELLPVKCIRFCFCIRSST